MVVKNNDQNNGLSVAFEKLRHHIDAKEGPKITPEDTHAEIRRASKEQPPSLEDKDFEVLGSELMQYNKYATYNQPNSPQRFFRLGIELDEDAFPDPIVHDAVKKQLEDSSITAHDLPYDYVDTLDLFELDLNENKWRSVEGESIMTERNFVFITEVDFEDKILQALDTQLAFETEHPDVG